MARERGNTQKIQRFRAAYLGEAYGNGAKAAQLAGYKNPAQAFHVLKQQRPEWVEALEKEFQENMIMRGREIDERLTALARDPSHRDHFKALDALARMHGKYKDSLNVTVDRQKLNKELDELIQSMAIARATHAAGLPKHADDN